MSADVLDFRSGTTVSWSDADTGRNFPVVRSLTELDKGPDGEPVRNGTRVAIRES